MKCTKLTHIGLVRKGNEDRFCIDEDLQLLAVADGMGGHRAGEIASTMAVDTLREHLKKQKRWLLLDPSMAMLKAAKEANKKIYKKAKGSEEYKGMGTTLTAALIVGNEVFIAHVGDSRAYLLRGDKIRQLTQDHSLVGELVRNGGITDEEARSHPQRNVLTRAMGSYEDIEVDIYRIPLETDDIILICTDGLYNLVGSDEIKDMVQNMPSLESSAQALLTKALERGAHDNITLVLCQVD